MAKDSAISWCDHTWSPWYGCTQVSMGPQGACEGCYARQLSEIRMGRVVFGGPGRGEGTRDARADSAWAEPLAWNRKTPGAFVFPSMCDPFDNHPDLAALRGRFFDLIRATPHLTWLLLTKRPGNIVKLFQEAMKIGEDHDDMVEFVGGNWAGLWPRNAAIGCTVVTQAEADRDIPKLLAAKAALNPAFAFASLEPLLGPVDLDCAWHGESALDSECWGDCAWCDKGYPPLHNCQRGKGDWERARDGLDWVITGGETDQGAHKARPSHPDWFCTIRDQCAAAGVAYHHKQNGEWLAEGQFDTTGFQWAPGQDGRVHWWRPEPPQGAALEEGHCSIRVGKARAGRALDGAEHDARPGVRP